MHIIFETPRLTFRQFTEADAPLILSLNSDPEIVKYVHEPMLKTVGKQKRFCRISSYLNTKTTWAAGPYTQKAKWFLVAGAV